MSEITQVQEISDSQLPANIKPTWDKAAKAVQLGNFGYVVSIAQAVLKECPGFVDGRKVLRKCAAQEVAKKGGSKKGLFGSSGLSLGKASGAAKKDPLEALVLLEKELEKDPGDAKANDLLHEIALRLGMPQTAAFALETVRQHNPENTKMLHKLADYYLKNDNPADASEVYNDIIKADPTDSTAVKGAKDATAQASMKKGGWGGDGGPQKKSQEEFEALEAASRTALTKDQLEVKRDNLAAEYAADQNNLKVVKELANVYEQLEDWANAEVFYSWGYSISNSDVSLNNKALDMKERAAEKELETLRAHLKSDPENEEVKARLAELEQVTIAAAVEDAKKRVEQNPTDPKLRYELGKALYDSGEYSDAIPHLQQATRNPHIRIKVLLLLGRTFEKKGMLDLAIKQLSDANSELTQMDGTKKEILYSLGQFHQEKGENEKGLEFFKKIYEVDYGYRDVAQKVESAYQG